MAPPIHTKGYPPASAVTDDERRWQAVLHRDNQPMDAFVYAVVTTGIFCVPQCPSRRPRRENVRFFSGWQQALQAGFRPCLRCRPAETGASAELILACEALAEEGATVAGAARRAGCTEAALRKRFQTELGISPRDFQQSVRLNGWKRALPDASGPLDAAFAAGFGSARGLYEGIGARLGMTPARYARGGKGMRLEYEMGTHALGNVLVAGTSEGVSFVALGEDTAHLLRELRHDYPNAELAPLDGPARWLPGVLRALAHPECAAEVPLEIQATAFQARVWKALREIPAGETRTYSGLAAALGNPSATRAVARACATNRVSVLIPCHRVVGASGDLTGYRWGKERKAALLESERQHAAFTLR
jgi:AraC family transcriptional regulator of adaptative response/methylated-DNA-[protein]-cysteine methyltransferase